jgi:hypothetical protein
MPDVSRRPRAIAVALAEKAQHRERLVWIATLTAGLATLYAITLFFG